jgi:hypothetical protein
VQDLPPTPQSPLPALSRSAAATPLRTGHSRTGGVPITGRKPSSNLGVHRPPCKIVPFAILEPSTGEGRDGRSATLPVCWSAGSFAGAIRPDADVDQVAVEGPFAVGLHQELRPVHPHGLQVLRRVPPRLFVALRRLLHLPPGRARVRGRDHLRQKLAGERAEGLRDVARTHQRVLL